MIYRLSDTYNIWTVDVGTNEDLVVHRGLNWPVQVCLVHLSIAYVEQRRQSIPAELGSDVGIVDFAGALAVSIGKLMLCKLQNHNGTSSRFISDALGTLYHKLRTSARV